MVPLRGALNPRRLLQQELALEAQAQVTGDVFEACLPELGP